MQTIFTYILDYFKQVDKWLLFFCTGFTALLVVLNYKLGIETRWLYQISSRLPRLGGFYLMYATAFIIPYLVLLLFKRPATPLPFFFWFLLLIAPAVFALKVNFHWVCRWVQEQVNGVWGNYYSNIVSLPSKLLLVALILWIVRVLGNYPGSFWGLTTRNFNWQPYAWMLVIMVPLVAFASTQSDFLNTYPKLKQVAYIDAHTNRQWWYRLLFEISYGLDFIGIELFFRGFLVLAFVRYAGPDAILPMAAFYCSIHFGKPLLECISSFFGGLLLGIIVYRTQSIAGGIIVHLGIAWMMELGGYWGRVNAE
jgi:hypothetical protein